MGSSADNKGGTDVDVRVRIGKARAAFHQLKNVLGSTDLSTITKTRILLSYSMEARPGKRPSPL